MNSQADMLPEDLDELVAAIRREHADRLPPAPRQETDDERQLHEERTRVVLERDVLRSVQDARRALHQNPLTANDEIEIVERIIGDLFTLPKLNKIIHRKDVNDMLIFPGENVRVDLADGSILELPPMARSARDIERVTYEISSRIGRPFNHESPHVDLELEPGVRFHAGGFDINQTPYIRIRKASMFGSSFDTLYDRGACDQGIAALLRAAIAAKMRILFVGRMGSGKTTFLRAGIDAIDPRLVITSIESSFELNIKKMGKHRWVIAKQERLPTTIDSTAITSSDLMPPTMRSGADVIIVGEARDTEANALIRAMITGQCAMGTCHGGSAAEGLEVLVDLAVSAGTGERSHDVKVKAYRATDLVVHLEGGNEEGRWVNEIVAPSVDEDGGSFRLHHLYSESNTAPDQRARPAKEPQIPMMRRLTRNSPGFDNRWWTNPEDTYKPLQIGGFD